MTQMLNDMFMFFYCNVVGKFMSEVFPETEQIGFFCFADLSVIGMFVIGPYNCCHYNKYTFFSLTIEEDCLIVIEKCNIFL